MADPSSQTPPDAEAPTEQSERARYLRTRLPVVSEGPVPARMINELLYCERLMYLEWVQGEWADNYFTADGTRVHKRTEKARPLKAKVTSKPAKSKPDETSEGDREEAEEEARPYQARSVWLTSQALGLTAKIDVVDVDGERVMPIEYKRGKKPKVAEGAWLPERAQVCAQVLLLREHDYRCDEAAIYYAGDRQRVPIEITQELIDVVLDSVLRARSLVSQATLPPPLVDSPKCQGCSLAGICLPDEVNLLAHSLPANETARVLDVATPASDSGHASAAQAPRRLYAARDDKLPLYVQEQGARLRLQGERLRIEGRDAPVEARLSNTSQVSLYGNVQVSTQALRELLTRNIPLSFFTTGGWLVGRATGIDGKNVELRKTQYKHSLDAAFCLSFAKQVVVAKILNSRTLLRRNHDAPDAVALSSLKQLSRKAVEAEDLGSLLGIEGSAARIYFEQFTGMLKTPEGSHTFDFEGRNRRPPRDPINALLSFCYSLLTKELTIAATTAGLDPLLGFYHQPHFGRPGLALDLMEEFRPLIADSVVVGIINNGVVQAEDFVHAAGSVALEPHARRRVIYAFERRAARRARHLPPLPDAVIGHA